MYLQKSSKQKKSKSDSPIIMRSQMSSSNDVLLPDKKGLMTREVTANYLCVSVSTLDNWTRATLIERVKVGRAVRYTRESIEKFIDENNKKRVSI